MDPTERSIIGARLRTERKARRWTTLEMARRIASHVTDQRPDLQTLVAYVKRWERGGSGWSERYRIAYAAALDVTEDELFAPEGAAGRQVPVDSPTVVERPTPSSLGCGTAPPQAKDDDVERRAALELLATLGIGSAALAATGEPVRQALAQTVSSEPRDLDYWQLACADHLHGLRTRPPVQVRDALIVDLLALSRQLRIADANTGIELRRVVAMLSMHHANALSRLGEHGAAIHWWRTARAAADASGDRGLRLVTRSEEAGFGLYGQRDLQTVLRLLDQARSIAGDSQSVFLADQRGTRAKALALLGRHGEAIREVHAFADLAGTAPPGNPIPGFWRADSVYFAESWVYAHAGDEGPADQARDRVLSYNYLDYQYATNVRLHEALCTVVGGGTDTGARQAVQILATLPPARHSQMITETGRMVLRAVPPEQWNRPAVRDLHALTSPLPHQDHGK
jgi:transcriptional regulator with XRE-family HTH domain